MSEKSLVLRVVELENELTMIHKITQCLATASHTVQDGDTSTITGVRNLLWLWRCEVEQNKRFREALENCAETLRYNLAVFNRKDEPMMLASYELAIKALEEK